MGVLEAISETDFGCGRGGREVQAGGILLYFEDSAIGCACRLEDRHSVLNPSAQRRDWAKRLF